LRREKRRPEPWSDSRQAIALLPLTQSPASTCESPSQLTWGVCLSFSVIAIELASAAFQPSREQPAGR